MIVVSILIAYALIKVLSVLHIILVALRDINQMLLVQIHRFV